MLDKRILVIGNDTVVSTVAADVGLSYSVAAYGRVSTVKEAPISDWSEEAIETFMRQHGSEYDAVIVDYDEQQALPALQRAGFAKPVVGLVSDRFDAPRMKGATNIVVLDIHRLDIVRETLDDLFQKQKSASNH